MASAGSLSELIHTHHSSAKKGYGEEEEGKPVLLRGHPANVFVVHNSAVNRTVSLHINSHSPWHSKFFPFSCSYFCISLLVAHLPFPPLCWEASPSHGPMLGQLSSREEASLARGCWKTLPRVVSSPPPPIPPTSAHHFLFLFLRGWNITG